LGGKQWAWSLVAAVSLVGLAVGAAQQNGSSSLPDSPTAQQSGSALQTNSPQASGSGDSGSQQSVPDAPSATSSQGTDNLRNLTRQVAPGKAPAQEPDQVQAPPPQTNAPNPDGPPQQEAPYIPKNAEEAKQFVIRQNVTYVPVPVTVLDKNHHQVAGLTYRDFRIYENGQRQHISFFSVDPVPMSVAFVIDQSMPKDTMKKVNESLSAIQGAFTPQDEAAVFTFGNGVTKQTTFTATQGDRLPAVLERSKKEGTEMGGPSVGGPLGMQGPSINGKAVDPNVNGTSRPGYDFNIPHETHTLSDAILEAAKELQTRPKERRRVIYVISDGKDMRSKASVREVIRFLQGNQETVYGTMVGDAATWGIGYLDRVHLPLIPQENVLPRYANATGGVLEAQFSADGMERSFATIAKEVRTQYTLGFYSHVPTIDGRYRTLDVHVERPNLEVKARLGYYPTAAMQ
jgi:VWFA-related protein